MTGLIKHCIQDCAKFLGIIQDKRTFCPEDCPLLETGQIEPHMFHSSNGNNKEIAAVCNFLVDLNLLVHSSITGEQDSFRSRFNTKIKELNRKIDLIISTKEKNKKSVFESSENEEQTKAILSLTKKVKMVEEICKNSRNDIQDLIQKSESLNEDKIIESVNNATNKQLRNQDKEFQRLKESITALINEVRFDPDNPKPTEIRTEQNSQEILKLSKDIYPLLSKTSETLEQTAQLLPGLEKILLHLEKRLG